MTLDTHDRKALKELDISYDSAKVLSILKTIALLLRVQYKIENCTSIEAITIRVEKKDYHTFPYFYLLVAKAGVHIRFCFGLNDTATFRADPYIYDGAAKEFINDSEFNQLNPKEFIWLHRKSFIGKSLVFAQNMKAHLLSFPSTVYSFISKRKNKLKRREHTYFSVILVVSMSVVLLLLNIMS